ncbi:MAG: hypothetical protein J7L47_08600, partial [Candidatus Odinarchaeota archaeon]|nr:hypothetical protein [Candidatus Odinarchaeota archaeon]
MLSSCRKKRVGIEEEKNTQHIETTIIEIYDVAYYKITIAKSKKLGNEMVYAYSLDKTIFDETTKYYIEIISRQIKKKNITSSHSLTVLPPTARNIFSTIEKEILRIIEHDLV